ncbi:MAG: ADP-ribosylglycohydrolase family protein [Limnochordaceae bacterium]|nr:ADP-ribosylglycohydrolase family protein [Limnochordaceae bacterium]
MAQEEARSQWREEARRQWMFHIQDTLLALRELGQDVSDLDPLVHEGQQAFDSDQPGRLWRQIALIRHALRQKRGAAPLLPGAESDAELLQRLQAAEEPDRPTSWRGLAAAVPAWPREPADAPSAVPTLSSSEYEDRTRAGWLGKMIGGALGTPVEGWPQAKIAQEHGEIKAYLRAPDTFNDDTTYELTFLSTLERTNGKPTSQDLGLEWVERIPVACTAEEIALRNMWQGILPPLSAWVGNPYAEWIGAQMRGEICGLVAPLQPARAATLAWRDALVSHVREGLYGEVFNAVMISLAYRHPQLPDLIEQALQYVPPRSHFAQAVRETVQACEASRTWQEAWALVAPHWAGRYHWVHTLHNIPAVIIGLWYGQGDFGRTIAVTTMCGGDTDCTAGQAGAIAGVLLGTSAIDPAWREPLGDHMESWVVGMERLSLDELTQRTCRWGLPPGQAQAQGQREV